MTIDVFCAWGMASDVGINITLTEEEQKIWCNGLVPVDLSADEAEKLAQDLLACAKRARELERELEAYESPGGG